MFFVLDFFSWNSDKQFCFITHKSVETISKYDKKHNDIKPSNFLIQEDISILDDGNKLCLSDFGFMNDRKGGTPLYASPECFQGTFVEKSDVYSLGGCYMSLLTNEETFARLLLLPLLTKNQKILAEKILKSNSLLKLVKQMLNSNPQKRPSIKTIIEIIEKTSVDSFKNLVNTHKELNYLLYEFSQMKITRLIKDHLIR